MPRPSVTAPDGATAPPRRRGKLWLWMGFGCAGLIGVLAAGVILLVIMIRPYERASRELAHVLQEVAPEGTHIDGAHIAFPAKVTIARVDLPPDPDRGLPALTLREISGTTSWRSWLRRRPNVSLATRVWGGAVHLRAVATQPLDPEALVVPTWEVDGTVNGVRLEEAVAWLNLGGAWRGRLDLTVTGTVDSRRPRTSSVSGTLAGREVHIPPLELGHVVLPPNRRTMLRGEATYAGDVIDVPTFTLRGTGYNLDATVQITLREPLDASLLTGHVALQLKEVATWRRTEDEAQLAGAMMQLLIQSKGKLHARIGGTVGKPEAFLDESAIIRGLLGAGG